MINFQRKQKKPPFHRIDKENNSYHESKAYLIGSGIASLASAVYLIKDGYIPGKNILLFEESDQIGGCLDARGSAETGYALRGARMFSDEAYTCTFDLLSSIPSMHHPNKTIKDELDEFNRSFKSYSKCRLVENGKKVNTSSLGFNWKDRIDLIKMMMRTESSLGTSQIQDHFAPGFFKTNFWFEWCTTFAFEPWHSAVEFKRYTLRFIQEFSRINTLAGVRRTPYNQHDAIVLPIVKWLKEKGVHFETNTRVTNLGFRSLDNGMVANNIHFIQNGHEDILTITENDYVFATLGSMVACSSFGSMTSAPILQTTQPSGAWDLWENIARGEVHFGRPSVFNSRINESKWESFTITCRDPTFFQLMEAFSGNEPGTGGLVTFKDSNWLMSIVLYHQPYFIGQPDNTYVSWGYGLFPDKKGNYVQKPMSECTGEEILIELCSHLKFDKELPSILSTSTCIPCLLPFVTSQFLTRKPGDRPDVVPHGYLNLGLIGQYCEIPDDVVFTVE